MTPALARHLEATYFEGYLALRGHLLEVLSDADLAVTLGGSTQSLGALCREIGDVEAAYTESLRTFRLAFGEVHADPTVETSVARLRAWFEDLDGDLMDALGALSAADVKGRRIQRGRNPGDFDIGVIDQLEIYRQALVIFCGKASVYLRAMDRPLPGLWAHWIE